MNNISDNALSIQVSLNGLSFCIKNTAKNKIEFFKALNFEKNETPYKIQEFLEQELDKEVFQNKKFKEVILVHRNELSTFVPQEYFNEKNLADYLKFNAKILRSDYLSYDNIYENETVNVYVPLVNINNLIIDHFGEFTYKHSSTVLIETLLNNDYEYEVPKVYINIEHQSFELIVIEKRKLLFYNMFDFSSQEDLSYYILFTMEQLNLSVEKTVLRFIGGVKRDDKNFEVVYKYVRDVDILESFKHGTDIAKEVSSDELSNHYILLNSFEG